MFNKTRTIITVIAALAVTALSVPGIASATEVFSPGGKGSKTEAECFEWQQVIEDVARGLSTPGEVEQAKIHAAEDGCIVTDNPTHSITPLHITTTITTAAL